LYHRALRGHRKGSTAVAVVLKRTLLTTTTQRARRKAKSSKSLIDHGDTAGTAKSKNPVFRCARCVRRG
jgi:hypothetical protein